MGFDPKGNPKLPEVDRDLLAELPDGGTNFNAMKLGFMKIIAELNPTILTGLIRADGSLDRDAMDDLSDTLEHIYDNITKVFPKDGHITDIKLMSDLSEDVNVTSQASESLTAAAGHAYIVLVATHVNSTRNWEASVKLTLSGSSARTLQYIPTITTAAILSGQAHNCLNSQAYGMLGGPGMLLGPGDALTITDETFVAADNVSTIFIYVDITLA